MFFLPTSNVDLAAARQVKIQGCSRSGGEASSHDDGNEILLKAY